MTQPPLKEYSTSTSKPGAKRWATQMLIGTLIYGAMLFIAAGRLNWIEGWIYLVLNTISQLIGAFVLTAKNPDLLAERSNIGKGTKNWDQFLSLAVGLIAPLLIMLTAGLEARFRPSALNNINMWIFGIILAFLCQMFVVWAMASNPFFALTVRIQEERGHSVVQRGPYQFVRHPGYLGSILFSLLCPLVLGSKWVVLPALFSCTLIVVRTSMEDATLQSELLGYREYATKVRWRVFPGVW